MDHFVANMPQFDSKKKLVNWSRIGKIIAAKIDVSKGLMNVEIIL